jgi:hypothetical protein
MQHQKTNDLKDCARTLSLLNPRRVIGHAMWQEHSPDQKNPCPYIRLSTRTGLVHSGTAIVLHSPSASFKKSILPYMSFCHTSTRLVRVSELFPSSLAWIRKLITSQRFIKNVTVALYATQSVKGIAAEISRILWQVMCSCSYDQCYS